MLLLPKVWKDLENTSCSKLSRSYEKEKWQTDKTRLRSSYMLSKDIDRGWENTDFHVNFLQVQRGLNKIFDKYE